MRHREIDINMLEEIFEHVVMVAARAIWWDADVFVEIKRFDVGERNFSTSVASDQFAIEAERCAAGCESEYSAKTFCIAFLEQSADFVCCKLGYGFGGF